MPLWTDLFSKIAKGLERVWDASFRIRTGQVYSPKALFGGSEFMSASKSPGRTMLNAKDDDEELSLGKYWEKYFGERGILDASWGPTEPKCLLRIFGICSWSVVILLSGRLIREMPLLLFHVLTNQRIYTFPSLFHIAYILRKIIVIKCSFTSSRKVQNFMSVKFIFISIARKEKLVLNPYRFPNYLGNPWFWKSFNFAFR